MNLEKSKRLWTVGELISWGASYFKEKSIESPRLCIELLLCDILNFTRLQLYMNFEKPLTKSELQTLKHQIKRVLNGEPLQYVLGWTQFINYKIFLRKKVFIPRPETEQLVAKVFSLFETKKDIPLSILDIGCGSGAISIAMAGFFKNSTIFAVDVDDDAIIQTEENARFYNLRNLKILKLDILKQVPTSQFDIIISNPPYVPIEEYEALPHNVLKEPKIALTDNADGLIFYKRFAEIFPLILKEKASFFLEVGWNQAEKVIEIFPKDKFSIKVEKDFQGIKRIIYGNRF